MKPLRQFVNFQSPQAPKPRVYGEKETAIVKTLFQSMAANYGGLFLANLDDETTQTFWERSWLASISGKNPERVAQALSFCLDTHSKPFTRADFQEAYRSLRNHPEHQIYRVKRLPKNTWQERREIARKHITQAKEILGQERT